MRIHGPTRGLAAGSLLLLACAAREAAPPVPVEVPPPRAAPVAASAVPTEPPPAATLAPSAPSLDEITIDVSATGETRMNGEVVATEDGLLDRAREAHARNPEVRAVLRVDGSVRYGVVIQTMDLLRRASITDVTFGVTAAAP